MDSHESKKGNRETFCAALLQPWRRLAPGPETAGYNRVARQLAANRPTVNITLDGKILR